MLKVCMLTYAMPPEHSGAAIQAIRLASQLSSNGVKIFFITQGNKEENLGNKNVAGFRVIRIYKETLFWKIIAPFRFFTALMRELPNFDIIHVHGVGYISRIAVVFGFLFNKKVLLKMTMFGEDDAMAIKNGAHGTVNFAFFSLASHYVALTHSFLNSCLDAGIPAIKISQIPNGVDTEKFKTVTDDYKAKLRTKLKIPVDKKVLVYAGIIRPEKGVDFLLDVISLVSSNRGDTVLLLLGPVETWLPAPEKKTVQDIIDRINILAGKGLVIYPGKVDNVNEYFQASDIFVSASIREGLQNVLIEAMACGLPPVMLEIPEVHKYIVVDGVEGIIINERDPRLFCNNLIRLIADTVFAGKMAAAARKKVLDYYSLTKVTAAYLKLYQGILSANAGPSASRSNYYA